MLLFSILMFGLGELRWTLTSGVTRHLGALVQMFHGSSPPFPFHSLLLIPTSFIPPLPYLFNGGLGYNPRNFFFKLQMHISEFQHSLCTKFDSAMYEVSYPFTLKFQVNMFISQCLWAQLSWFLCTIVALLMLVIVNNKKHQFNYSVG